MFNVPRSTFHVPCSTYNAAVFQMDGAVGDGGEALIVCDDDEGLSELCAQVEEQLVQLRLVFAVETS